MATVLQEARDNFDGPDDIQVTPSVDGGIGGIAGLAAVPILVFSCWECRSAERKLLALRIALVRFDYCSHSFSFIQPPVREASLLVKDTRSM